MTTAITPAITATHRARRLRTTVKRLVIELGYLENCLDEGLLDDHLRTAAIGIDAAIDRLNHYLANSTESRPTPWAS
ncbi:MAG: hypothetical protein O3A14_16305 [Cyanobacteria bacterium]|nr:hypothetical protein [Cyanobacteriota bacterium]